MKLLTYKINDSDSPQIGVLQNQSVYNLNKCFGNISLIDLIQLEKYQEKVAAFICNEDCEKHDIENIIILPPIKPNSFRDAYAFRQHVATSRKNRGVDMIDEFDQFPVFYFSNHNAIFADREDIELMPDHFEKLDYELEFAIVIGKGGGNILSKDEGTVFMYANHENAVLKSAKQRMIPHKHKFKDEIYRNINIFI
jgi:fumarylacetoacetate (FAA) hydrolase